VLGGLLVMAAGIPVYFLSRKRHKKVKARTPDPMTLTELRYIVAVARERTSGTPPKPASSRSRRSRWR